MAAVTRSWMWPVLLALMGAAAAIAQATSRSESGALTGRLTDSYSTPLIGATVIVRNEVTGAEARTTTTKSGAYRFTGLGAGEYTLIADSPALGRGRVDGIVVSAGHEARVQAAIELERPKRASIAAALHDMEPAAQVVSTTLPAEQLQQLPLTGRRWQDFVLDTPASTVPADEGGAGRVSLRGAGQSSTDVTLDGGSRSLAFGFAGIAAESNGGEGEIGSNWAQGRGAGLGGPAMSQTAIREVRIAAGNAGAESERAAAGAMNVESRRGANELHGQTFFFDRQNSWGARNPFAQWWQQ